MYSMDYDNNSFNHVMKTAQSRGEQANVHPISITKLSLRKTYF